MYGSVFSVLFFPAIAALCELTDPEDCTLKANLPCWMYTMKECCTPDELKLKFPDLYAISDANPGPVSDFGASIFYDVRPQNNKTYPGVNLTFTPPQDGSISFVKGFHISRIRSSSPGKVFCYIFNMSGASWSAENDKNVKFILPIFPIKPGDTYLYDIYTLPKPDPDLVESRHVFVKAIDYANSSNPASWSPIITFHALHEYRMVVTEFEHPPEQFPFQRFHIYLWSESERRTIVDKIVSDTNYWFGNVTAGIYEIWVQPVDPHLYDPSHCICRDAMGGCDACTTTKTFNFTVKDVPLRPDTSPSVKDTTSLEPDPLSTTEKEPKDKSSLAKILIVVFATFGAVLLVGVVVVFYWYRCRPGQYGPKDLNHNDSGFDTETVSVITVNYLKNGGHLEKRNNAIDTKFPVKKKVFLLYEEDHQYHRLVIDKFASYLSQYCKCDVELAELQHDAPWVHQDLAQAEYVVIVNSEAAFKANLSSNTQKSPGKNTSISSINSIRNRFMRDERYDHIIMVYFSYTDEKYILPDICTGYKYKLMKHFTDFLLHVHKLHRADNLSRYDLPFDGDHKLRPVGQQLLDAIDKATKFETENPNWYIQTHGIHRGISNTSQESWHQSGDSGCPEDPENFSPLPTPINFPNDPWSKVNLQRPVDERSVVTIRESDLKSDGELPCLFQKSLTKQRPPLRLSITNDPNKPLVKETEQPKMFSPPTESPTEFVFFAPDCISDSDVISQTQSRQLEGIVDLYTETLKDLVGLKGSLKCQSEADEDQGQYDKEADLAILDAHSKEVMFNSCMELDSISLGSVGGISM